MTTRSTILAAAVLLGLAAPPASAQTAPAVNKTWVSSTGTDTGSCQLAAPCKTFAYAITETNAGGEIDVKDSGAYGAFTISKSITIVADGVVASVGVGSDGNGINIVSTSSQPVTLRGLTVNVHNANAGYGIYIHSNALVVLDHDILQGSLVGVAVEQSPKVIITNSLISGNAYGVNSASTATSTYIGNDTISANGYAFAGPLNSFGNNSIIGNLMCDACSAITKVNPQ